MSDLKPCPFCGWKTQEQYNEGEDCFWLTCHRCDSQGPLADTQEEAIEAWNKRAVDEYSQAITDMENAVADRVAGRADECRDKPMPLVHYTLVFLEELRNLRNKVSR